MKDIKIFQWWQNKALTLEESIQSGRVRTAYWNSVLKHSTKENSDTMIGPF
jgi:hypothetical protein